VAALVGEREEDVEPVIGQRSARRQCCPGAVRGHPVDVRGEYN
jgi:hypothetical protein